MVKVCAPSLRSSLLLMLAAMLAALVVRLPLSNSVPVLVVVTVPPVIVMFPRIVSVPLPIVTNPPPAIPVETMFKFVIVSLIIAPAQVPGARGEDAHRGAVRDLVA